jgi:hypothetical protein
MMTVRVRPWLAIPFRWMFGGANIRRDHRQRVRMSARQDALTCEPLEDRVVLSGWGDTLAQRLSSEGVITGPVVVCDQSSDPPGPWAGQNTQATQLQTELQGLAAKSGVTVADLTKLSTDEQTIEQSGYWFEGQNLQKAVSELATAVASGSDMTQAHADFTALFKGSSVPQSAIDATFNDLVQALKDSGVSAADLTTVATDQTNATRSIVPGV